MHTSIAKKDLSHRFVGSTRFSLCMRLHLWIAVACAGLLLCSGCGKAPSDEPASQEPQERSVMEKPTLTEIRIEGNTKIKADELMNRLGSQSGGPLDQSQLFEDAQSIEKFYAESGFTGVKVKYVINEDPQAGKANVVFQITE